MPHRVGCGCFAGEHEGLRSPAFAGSNLLHAASGGYRAVLISDRIAAFALMSVAVLDQKPVVAVAAVALAILPHAHEHPTALQLLAREHEFEVPLPKRVFRIATVFRRPEAAIPKHNGATAVFTLRDCALEVAVVERVVLDLHCQAPVTGVEGWPFCHRP